MLNFNSFAGNLSIPLFFTRGQFSLSRFLLWLERDNCLWLIPRKTRIFPSAPLWKLVILPVTNGFVMLQAFISVAQKHDFASTLANHVVLHCVTLVFAAIILVLRLLVLWTIEPTLAAIDDQLQAWTLIEYCFLATGFTCGNCLLYPNA